MIGMAKNEQYSSDHQRVKTSDQVRILIADDQCLVRDSLAEFIRSSSQWEVMVADSLKSAINVVRHAAPIDILLLDLAIFDMEGMKSIDKLVSIPGLGSVVLVANAASRDLILQSVSRGVKGYISKSMRLEALMNALSFVAMGETYLPASILSDAAAANSGITQLSTTLNAREIDVLRLLTDGLPNKEIARRCGSTEVRIKMHMRAICKKLNVPNRTSAAMKARELGII